MQDDFLTAFGLSSSQSEADISRDLSQLDDTTSAASIFEDVKAKLKIPKVTGNSGWTTWLPATPQSADTVGAEKELPSDPISVNSTTNNFGAQSDDMVAADDVLTSWTNDGWNEVELTASNVTATPSLPSEVPQWPEAALNLSSVISPSFETDLSTNSSLSASLLANSNLLTSSSLSSDLSNSTIAFTPSNAVDVAEETNVCDTFGSEGSSEQPTGLPSSELDRSDVEILLRGVVERVEDLQKSSQTASDSRDLRIILPANAPAVPQVAGTTTVSNETRMTVDCSEAESKR